MSSVAEDFWALVIAVVGVAVLVAIPCLGWKWYKCKDTALNSGRDYKFSVITGCYIQQPNHEYVPLGNWRVTD